MIILRQKMFFKAPSYLSPEKVKEIGKRRKDIAKSLLKERDKINKDIKTRIISTNSKGIISGYGADTRNIAYDKALERAKRQAKDELSDVTYNYKPGFLTRLFK